jgi:tetratricopeptide (TPR) repeat protein
MPRLIPEASWKESFLQPDGRYDGKKFERLALELLERLYGDGWQATASSHDGSRDYEKRDRNGWMWAECKAYSDRLSIYVLSPTLVMALLEQPHTIIVISRSRLNDNAVRHLSSYQAISGKAIVAYDEEALDHAIINANLHGLYFPGLICTSLTQPKLQVRCYISQDALSNPSDLDPCRPLASHATSTRMIEVVRFGLLRLDIVIRNMSSAATATTQLHLKEETLDPSIRVIAFGEIGYSTIANIAIPPGGIIKVKLILQPLEPRESLSLPQVDLIEQGVCNTQLEFGSVHVSNLYQIDLVGEAHRRLVDAVDHFLDSRRRSVFVAIEGSSGTGKSRLLQEVAVKGLGHGFRCHFYNPELEDPRAAERIIRSLLADLCDLPLTAESFDEAETRGSERFSSPAAFATRVLYDRSFPIWRHTQELVDAIVERLLVSRTLIIIDNVQFASEAFVEFLNQLTSALNAHHDDCRAGIILCFNSDYDRPESQSGRLLAKLRAWSADKREQWNSTLHCQLCEFSKGDVAEFIGRALSGDRDGAAAVQLFEYTLSLLGQYVQPRPLNLWQSLMYLADEGILSIERGRLQVRGDQTLIFRVNSLPTKLQDLLLLRWTRIKANESRGGITENELEATLRAAYILGSDHRDRLLALGATEKAISDLMRAGILSADGGGRIRFFHHQLFIFARGMYLRWEQSMAATLKQSMEKSGLTASKFQPFFILAHFAGKVTGQLVAATIKHMAERGLTPEYWKQYTTILLEYLMSSERRLSSSCLQGVSLISQWEQRLESLDRGAATLSDFLARRLLAVQRADLPGDGLFRFYHDAINGFLSIYDDGRALEVIDLALRDLDAAQFKSYQDKQIASAKILNRRTATLKNFGRVEEAVGAGQEALVCLRQAGCRSLEVETLFDVGSALLQVQERRDEAWELFEEGCRLFDNHPDQMLEPAPCRRFYVRGQIALRDGRFEDTFCICSQGVAYCRQINNHFWGVRLLTLEVVARLISGGGKSHELETIERLLIQAWDWVNVNHAERSRWSLSYLEGKFLLRKGQLQQAAKAFANAIGSLAGKLRAPEQVVSRRHILLDIAACCRRHRLSLGQQVISCIPSATMRAEFDEVLHMSTRLFRIFESERKSIALFCHTGEIVELP